MARQGWARLGRAHGLAGLGSAGRGRARLGLARRGVAWLGVARFTAWHGSAGLG